MAQYKLESRLQGIPMNPRHLYAHFQEQKNEIQSTPSLVKMCINKVSPPPKCHLLYIDTNIIATVTKAHESFRSNLLKFSHYICQGRGTNRFQLCGIALQVSASSYMQLAPVILTSLSFLLFQR